jgi:diguanylate cyclase (GGDEF) domain
VRARTEPSAVEWRGGDPVGPQRSGRRPRRDRYGGEEFVAVLDGVSPARAIGIAEIRVAFERASIDIGTGTPIQVTVSAGCAQLDDDRDTSAGLAVADVWLSQAKRAGRNQVVGLWETSGPDVRWPSSL